LKKYLLLIALLGLAALACADDYGISVNSPYLVTEWQCGQDLKVQWTKWGDWTQLNLDPGNRKVQILLRRKVARRAPAEVKLIADNVPATDVNGSFNWRISGVSNGEYHVVVRTVNKQHKGQSEVFYIKGCLQLPVKGRKL